MSDHHERKLSFIPVRVRPRHDGWTKKKQVKFIQALAETGCVQEACRRVGMSTSSARALRMRSDAQSFRYAWEAATDYGLHLVEEDAVSRSRHGVARPIFYKGEQVGEWRHHDERLTMFLLKTRRPQRYGKWIDKLIDFDADEAEDDPAVRLDGGIARIEWEYEPDNHEDDDDQPGKEDS